METRKRARVGLARGENDLVPDIADENACSRAIREGGSTNRGKEVISLKFTESDGDVSEGQAQPGDGFTKGQLDRKNFDSDAFSSL